MQGNVKITFELSHKRDLHFHETWKRVDFEMEKQRVYICIANVDASGGL